MTGLIPPPEKIAGNTRLTADGYPNWMDGGVTIAWELIPAVTIDTTLPDGTLIRAGHQYIDMGAVMVKVTGGGVASAIGKYAPYDSTQTDGRQTLTRGDVGLMDDVMIKHRAGIYNLVVDTNITGLIIGGLLWRQRIKVGGTNQATLANLLVAMPLIELTRE